MATTSTAANLQLRRGWGHKSRLHTDNIFDDHRAGDSGGTPDPKIPKSPIMITHIHRRLARTMRPTHTLSWNAWFHDRSHRTNPHTHPSWPRNRVLPVSQATQARTYHSINHQTHPNTQVDPRATRQNNPALAATYTHAKALRSGWGSSQCSCRGLLRSTCGSWHRMAHRPGSRHPSSSPGHMDTSFERCQMSGGSPRRRRCSLS